MPTKALRRGLPSVFALLVLTISCRDAAPTSASPVADPSKWLVRVERGDDQTGDAQEETIEPLVASVQDARGRAVEGAPLTWIAEGGGTIRPEQAATGADGMLRAAWTLGSVLVPQLATATAPAGQRVSFRGHIGRAPDVPIDVLEPLAFATFEGSGQVVHPDVIGLPYAWDGGRARLLMAITPYPFGDPNQENPSIFVSRDGRAWTVPDRASNPVVRPRNGYLSDPSVVYNPADHRLWMYYREVVDGQNVIRLVTTLDGVRWNGPDEVIRVAAHGLISPSVVRRGPNEWLMWSVNGGPDGCYSSDAFLDLRRSSDGVHWSRPERTRLDQPGGYPWHVDVHWIRKRQEYWALYNLKVSGSCTTSVLYLATSTDGVNWTTYRNPVLQRDAIPAFADVVYRSSFLFSAADDAVTFYFSGARYDGRHYVWAAAMQRRDRAALFEDLNRTPSVRLMRVRRSLPNPEAVLIPRRLKSRPRSPAQPRRSSLAR